jgi:N6-adenosine-specific RNA methylase IME4
VIGALAGVGATFATIAIHCHRSKSRTQGAPDVRKQFKTILIDPPWPETGAGRIKREADRHYPLLKVGDMPDVITAPAVFAPAADCHLYLWATDNCLADALWLMRSLGFRYVTNITWTKPDDPHSDKYFRGRTEQLLFGVRGDGLGLRRPWTQRRDLSTSLIAEQPRVGGKIIHTAKPEDSNNLIEAASPPHRLELFARRRGWTSWGNELGTLTIGTVAVPPASPTSRCPRTMVGPRHRYGACRHRPVLSEALPSVISARIGTSSTEQSTLRAHFDRVEHVAVYARDDAPIKRRRCPQSRDPSHGPRGRRGRRRIQRRPIVHLSGRLARCRQAPLALPCVVRSELRKGTTDGPLRDGVAGVDLVALRELGGLHDGPSKRTEPRP